MHLLSIEMLNPYSHIFCAGLSALLLCMVSGYEHLFSIIAEMWPVPILYFLSGGILLRDLLSL